MPLRRPTGFTLGLVLVIVVAACGDDGGPSQPRLTGTYALSTINGTALPYNFGNFRITSGRIEFNSRGRLTQVLRRQNASLSGWGPEFSDSTVPSYRLSRDSMFIEHAPVPVNTWVDTATLHTGVVRDDVIAVRTRLSGAGTHEFVYGKR